MRRSSGFSAAKPRLNVIGARPVRPVRFMRAMVPANGMGGLLHESNRITLPGQIVGAGVTAAIGGKVAERYGKDTKVGVIVGSLAFMLYAWWYNNRTPAVVAETLSIAPPLTTNANVQLQPVKQAVGIAATSVAEFAGSPPATELVRLQYNLRNALNQVSPELQADPTVVRAQTLLSRFTSLLDLDEGAS